MRYILQIFTGGWDTLNYTTEEILNRLKSLIPRMDVEKVILGWYPDAALYRPIGEYLRENNIDMLLWLPVFAELGDRVPMTPAVDLWGNLPMQSVEQQGETFAFSCPTDPANLKAVIDMYDSTFSDAGFSCENIGHFFGQCDRSRAECGFTYDDSLFTAVAGTC